MMRKAVHIGVGAASLLFLALGTAGLFFWLPAHYAGSAQDAVWAIPAFFGATWWVIGGVIGGIGAITMFLFMVMNQPFSALLLSRIIIMVAMALSALVPLNSGWLPWGWMLSQIGGCLAALLLATNWCERPHPWRDVASAVHIRRVERKTF